MVRLRRATAADTEKAYEIIADAAGETFIGTAHLTGVLSREQTPDYNDWWIAEADDVIVGWAGANPGGYHGTNISIAVHEDYRGNGYGHEILHQLICLPEYAGCRLIGHAHRLNVASIRMLEKNAFSFSHDEGTYLLYVRERRPQRFQDL